MLRVQVQNQDPNEVRESVMDLMNEFLNNNDGKLINVKILRNNEVCVYYITGLSVVDPNWEQKIQNDVLRGYKLVPTVVELGPTGLISKWSRKSGVLPPIRS